MPKEYQIAFWNLENLFDIDGSPHRDDKIKRAIGDDIKGWTQALLDRKISRLASVISWMNSGDGPDILGVSEIENEYVMKLLVQKITSPGRNYKIAHHNSKDKRGIDVGFIYDYNLFRAEKKFDHFVMRRNATRDLLQVNFRSKNGKLFVIVCNHWPSRSGAGAAASAAYRAIAGETLAYFHERIMEEQPKDTPVLALGDFNDEPFDLSLTDFALSSRSQTKVVNAHDWYFFNLMWPLVGKSLGTYYFENLPIVFDQFLANKNLIVTDSPMRVIPDSVEIIQFPDMVAAGDYPRPIPFGGMGKDVNENGFSDHFPIAVKVVEQD